MVDCQNSIAIWLLKIFILFLCNRAPVCEEIINCRGDQVRLAVRVRVFPYPESTCATWIMFACKYKSVLWSNSWSNVNNRFSQIEFWFRVFSYPENVAFSTTIPKKDALHTPSFIQHYMDLCSAKVAVICFSFIKEVLLFDAINCIFSFASKLKISNSEEIEWRLLHSYFFFFGISETKCLILYKM